MPEVIENKDSSDDLGGFEERADHIAEEALIESTVNNDYYDKIHSSLIARGLILLQGPRGCGKTHMMRYTHVMCKDNGALPLSVYVTFNRYLRLEPLLLKRTDALNLFQTWVLGRIVQAADDLSIDLSKKSRAKNFRFTETIGITREAIDELITHLERGADTSGLDERSIQFLSIEKLINALLAMSNHFSRKRVVLLLDDAALTLTPEFLVEFFDIVRVLKNPRISLKVSIYPGTTEFGPRFHASHEGTFLGVWLPVDHISYCSSMEEISNKRLPLSSKIPAEIKTLLMYAAFGVPRAYLAMLREWDSGSGTTQQRLNKIIQGHTQGRFQEYASLAVKMPRFITLVTTGEKFFHNVVEQFRIANEGLIDKNEKQVILGIELSSIDALTERMLHLLMEAGLLYELPRVSHGTDRTYIRYMPHFAALIDKRVFSAKSKGASSKQIIDFINRDPSKHPLRRRMDNIITSAELGSLRIDMPECQKCSTPRLNESQKFCHQCGNKLVDDSTFSRCMQLEFEAIPYLTEWQISRLKTYKLKRIGDLLSLQDPGTELRKIYMIGVRRAEKMVEAVETYVDEFLS